MISTPLGLTIPVVALTLLLQGTGALSGLIRQPLPVFLLSDQCFFTV